MSDPAQILTQRRLQQALGGAMDSPGRATADLATETSQANINELLYAIDRAPTPEIKALLMQELQGIKDTMSNLMGPIQPPPMPSFIPESGVMRLPYDPREQRPDVQGGFKVPPRRFMDGIGPMQRPPNPPDIYGVRG